MIQRYKEDKKWNNLYIINLWILHVCEVYFLFRAYEKKIVWIENENDLKKRPNKNETDRAR